MHSVAEMAVGPHLRDPWKLSCYKAAAIGTGHSMPDVDLLARGFRHWPGVPRALPRGLAGHQTDLDFVPVGIA